MSEKIVNDINPTFLLRGIDIQPLIEWYMAGKYGDSPLPAKIQSAQFSIKINEQYHQNCDDRTYTYGHRMTGDRVVTSVNHDKYIMYKKRLGGESSDHPAAGGICNWCRQPFTEIPWGIPLQIVKFKGSVEPVTREAATTEQSVAMPPIPSLPPILQNKVAVYVDDPDYCRGECLYSGYKREFTGSCVYRDPLYLNSEQMIHLMYRIMYPDAPPLREALHWKLLKENGGPLSSEEYYQGSHYYQRSTNLVTIPVKVEYFKSAVSG